MGMLFTMKPKAAAFDRLRVTPDPAHAEALERKIKSLTYNPQNGFHRDRSQDRAPLLRRAAR